MKCLSIDVFIGNPLLGFTILWWLTFRWVLWIRLDEHSQKSRLPTMPDSLSPGLLSIHVLPSFWLTLVDQSRNPLRSNTLLWLLKPGFFGELLIFLLLPCSLSPERDSQIRSESPDEKKGRRGDKSCQGLQVLLYVPKGASLARLWFKLLFVLGLFYLRCSCAIHWYFYNIRGWSVSKKGFFGFALKAIVKKGESCPCSSP